jgi:hypothetical protein
MDKKAKVRAAPGRRTPAGLDQPCGLRARTGVGQLMQLALQYCPHPGAEGGPAAGALFGG